MSGRLIPYRRQCEVCSSLYEAPRVDSRYCSAVCRRTSLNARRRARARAARAALGHRCVFCDRPIGGDARSDKRFCSDSCARASRFNTNRADRRLRVEVEGKPTAMPRTAIYERDGWTCMLCGKAIDRSRHHPDPMSASLDHVVPLSMGGTNAAENLQASHLACNISVGNKKLAENLRPAPQWLGVEYSSAPGAAKVLQLPIGRVHRLLRSGLIPSLDRRPNQPWRIPVTFLEGVLRDGMPKEFLVDHRYRTSKRPPKTHRELTCVQCGLVVQVPISPRSPKKYCSAACAKEARAHREGVVEAATRRGGTKRCLICGEPNPVVQNQYRNLICGRRTCRNELRHRQLAATREATRGLPTCKTCGEKFAWRERGGGRQPGYCSEDCRREANRARARAHSRSDRDRISHEGKRSRLEAKQQNPRCCLTCGEPIPAQCRADKRYCDRACWSSGRSANSRGR